MSALDLKYRPRRLLVERLEQRLTMCAGPVVSQPPIEINSYDQEMLELINRARANPLAEASRQGIALNEGLPAGTLGSEVRQPLAPSTLLTGVAKAHSADMIQRSYFAHINPDGIGPLERAEAAGYYTTYVGENLSAKGLVSLPDAAKALHDSLFLSAPHRVNTLLGGYREVGLGLQYGSIKFTNGNRQDGSIVTQLFGGGYPGKIYVTGVAYDDTLDNNFYNVGEGRGSIIVEARDEQGHRVTTTSGSSGGYALSLDPGNYRILAFTANRTRMLDLGSVNLVSANVKKDVHVESFAGAANVQESIVLSGSGNSLAMSDANVSLIDVCRIDIRGSGDNVLQVDATKLRDSRNGYTLLVMADRGDTVNFDAGWVLDSTRIQEGSFVRRFKNGATSLDLIGPSDYTNPLDRFDVSADRAVTAGDALAVINELASRRHSDDSTGAVRTVTQGDLDSFSYLDVTGDGLITALDALNVINELAWRYTPGSGSGEEVSRTPLPIAHVDDVFGGSSPIASLAEVASEMLEAERDRADALGYAAAAFGAAAGLDPIPMNSRSVRDEWRVCGPVIF